MGPNYVVAGIETNLDIFAKTTAVVVTRSFRIADALHDGVRSQNLERTSSSNQRILTNPPGLESGLSQR